VPKVYLYGAVACDKMIPARPGESFALLIVVRFFILIFQLVTEAVEIVLSTLIPKSMRE
jgi:hypothetical protein